MTEEAWQGHHELVATHYGRVLRETEERAEELAAVVSPDYIDRMKKGCSTGLMAVIMAIYPGEFLLPQTIDPANPE